MTVTVSECNIYPLKSGKVVHLSKMDLTAKGPLHDRMWMLVEGPAGKNPGRFISQRENSGMALLEAIPDAAGNMVFRFPGFDDFHVHLDALTPSDKPVKVWQSTCDALDAGSVAAEWFSEALGQDCRLVKMPDAFTRPTPTKHIAQPGEVSFADSFPILVANEASLQALQSKAAPGSDITMQRFRPNIVLKGLEAFEEDVVHKIAIGDAELELLLPCTRCVMTTVNPASGHQGEKTGEPVKTLRTYRFGKAEGLAGMFFGQHASALRLAPIHVGDEVRILSTRKMHPAVAQAGLKFGT